MQENNEKYRAMANDLSAVYDRLCTAKGYLNTSLDNMNEGVIVNGKSYDNGILNGTINAIQGICDDLQNIITYCNNSIVETSSINTGTVTINTPDGNGAHLGANSNHSGNATINTGMTNVGNIGGINTGIRG